MGPSTKDLRTFTHHVLIPPAYHYVSLVAGNVATVTILEGMVTQRIVTIGAQPNVSGPGILLTIVVTIASWAPLFEELLSFFVSYWEVATS